MVYRDFGTVCTSPCILYNMYMYVYVIFPFNLNIG